MPLSRFTMTVRGNGRKHALLQPDNQCVGKAIIRAAERTHIGGPELSYRRPGAILCAGRMYGMVLTDRKDGFSEGIQQEFKSIETDTSRNRTAKATPTKLMPNKTIETKRDHACTRSALQKNGGRTVHITDGGGEKIGCRPMTDLHPDSLLTAAISRRGR